MAFISGIDGSVTIPGNAGGQTGLIYRWSADVDREIINITSFDDSGSAKVKRGGMYQLTGSCEAWFDSTAIPVIDGNSGLTVADATPVAAFELQSKTGDTWTFGALLSSIRLTAEKIGQIVITLNFQSDGDVVAAA